MTSDLIERAFAAVPVEEWGAGGGTIGAAPRTVTEVRRRIREGCCPGCGGPRPANHRKLMCDACRAWLGYCAQCETVMPLTNANFAPPKPSDRGAMHRALCRACQRANSRARRHVPPCLRCGGERIGKYKLCAACRERWGYCPTCQRVLRIFHFGKAPPSRAPYRQQHAGRCRGCDAARKAAVRATEVCRGAAD